MVIYVQGRSTKGNPKATQKGYTMWGGIVIGIGVTFLLEFVVLMLWAFITIAKEEQEKKMNQQTALVKREPALPAEIIKIESTEPTFGTPLDQVRRDFRPEIEGRGALKRVVLQRLAAEWQLHNEAVLSKMESEIRHKHNLQDTAYKQEEELARIDSLLIIRSYLLNEVIQKALDYSEMLHRLGIDDPEIEMKVKRILMQSLDQLGLDLLDANV